MWDIAVAVIKSIIIDCIKKVSIVTYRSVQRKIKGEKLVSEIFRDAREGNLQVGDRVTIAGIFSEYIPVVNPSQFLSEYRKLKFIPHDPFHKSDTIPIDKNYCLSPGRYLSKWLGENPIEVSLPTATTRFDSIENVYVGSILPRDEQFAYGKSQIPVFYSADYGENSIDLLNLTTGTAIVMDSVIVPVPQQYRTILSETVPTLTREDGLSIPFGLKVLRTRKLMESHRIYINQWVLSHFISRSMDNNEVWSRIVWENFLKGNTSINIGEDGRYAMLPHFVTHDYLYEIKPIVFGHNNMEYDVYLTTMLIKPCLFQISFAKTPADVSEIRNEFFPLAQDLMSQEYLKFLTNDIEVKIDYESDQRGCFWKNKQPN